MVTLDPAPGVHLEQPTGSPGASEDANGSIAVVTLSHPGRLNAMTRAMWRDLRAVFTELAQQAALRCILLRGQGGQFCAGGDISEYPSFRFDEATLAEFHETEVWGALQAMLDCEVPIVAQIEGHCMGAGLEIASCCDIRVSADNARFGAPIARLGFPMAPKEAACLMRLLGESTVREMLLEGRVLDAVILSQRGYIQRTVPPDAVAAEAMETCRRIAKGAPQAARQNKRTWRALLAAGDAPPHPDLLRPYAYANSPEHREGIAAFIDKRSPTFSRT